MLGVAGIKFWFFSSTLFTYRLGDSSMNFNVLENPLAALFAVAAIFIGYYALIYFVVVVLLHQGVPQQRRPRH
jgi:hypothetical protein